MASWAELLTGTEPGEHVVQLYSEDDWRLTRNVSRYLAEGLRRGDGLVVIATPEHTSTLGRHLGAEEPRLAHEAAYRIDLFAHPRQAADLHPIVCTHDHVLAGAGTLRSGGRPRA